MTLFFETAMHSQIFLTMVPLGFILGILLDVLGPYKWFRALIDVILMLLCASAIALLVIVFHDDRVRIYHLLGCMVGWMIYTLGLRRTIVYILHKLFSKNEAGINGNKTEI